jgi:hypothetical protein
MKSPIEPTFSIMPTHSVLSAAHYFGMLGKPVPEWARGKVVHITAGGSVWLWDTCPICVPKDRS